MTIEVALIISVASVAFGIYQGLANTTRNRRIDTTTETTQMTTVIVKLENIGSGVAEIKGKMCNLEEDLRKTREEVIRLDASCQSAHKRIDEGALRARGEQEES